jgi:hypothetical protein
VQRPVAMCILDFDTFSIDMQLWLMFNFHRLIEIHTKTFDLTGHLQVQELILTVRTKTDNFTKTPYCKEQKR